MRKGVRPYLIWLVTAVRVSYLDSGKFPGEISRPLMNESFIHVVKSIKTFTHSYQYPCSLRGVVDTSHQGITARILDGKI